MRQLIAVVVGVVGLQWLLAIDAVVGLLVYQYMAYVVVGRKDGRNA